ncbi:hypothetical protein LP43_2356 [Methylophaga thiooxydans]|uniref:Toxin CptA n=1 Tax=Methylophaga thiooxydans TaxID=392484 RepID=A0A0A0BDK7_9GAMM|nr:protein YgfX [Methylophaga thiooxydans]KGM06041.1 hypothetical protein LP43_2356 [Methylophaga thiooxydans]
MTVLIKTSKGVVIYLFGIHIVAIFTLWLIEIDVIFSSLLSMLICLSLFVYCRRYLGVMRHKRLTQLRLDKQNQCFLSFSDNSLKGPYSLKGSVIFNVALIIYLGSGKHFLSKPLFIPRDAVDDKAWRQLRVRLRDPDSWD